MNLPGFSAESSLGPSAGVYRRRNRSSSLPTGKVRGLVSPAEQRQRWCETRYRGGLTHYFPVTVCESILPHLEGSVATMAAAAPLGRQTSLSARAARSSRLWEGFGRFQRCRVVYLPFYGEVTTTKHCEDSIPDSSVLQVQDHPELTTYWTGGINDIPPPYNPGWFGFVKETCGCCGGFQQCPDGSCIPLNRSCTLHPA